MGWPACVCLRCDGSVCYGSLLASFRTRRTTCWTRTSSGRTLRIQGIAVACVRRCADQASWCRRPRRRRRRPEKGPGCRTYPTPRRSPWSVRALCWLCAVFGLPRSATWRLVSGHCSAEIAEGTRDYCSANISEGTRYYFVRMYLSRGVVFGRWTATSSDFLCGNI